MTINFTVGFIEKLPFVEGNKPNWYWDSKQPGLGLKVTKTRKTFIGQARFKGVSKRTTLGAFPNIGLPVAREMARDTLVDIANGIDPSKDKKRHEAFSVAVGEVYKKYLSEKKLKPGTVEQHKSRWRTVLSVWEKAHN